MPAATAVTTTEVSLRRKTVISLALGEALVWSGTYYIFPAFLVRWEEHHGWLRTDITLAFLLASVATALASPISGRLIDRGLGPWLMLISAVVAGFAIAALSLVTQLTYFYLLWIVIGITLSGCLYEPCFALVTRAFGKDAKKSITAITLVAGFAGTITFPLSHLLSERFGWQLALIVFSTITITVAAPLLFYGTTRLEFFYQQAAGPSDNQVKGDYSFLRYPVFWLIAFGFALAGIVHGATLHHLIPLLSARGIALGVAVTAISFIGPMQVAGRIIIAVLGNRIGNHTTALAMFISMMVSILCLIAASWVPTLLPLFILCFGAGYGMLSIIRPVIARDMLGEQNFGSKSGMLALVYLLGAGSAPWIGSLLWQIGGYALVLPVLFMMLIIAMSLYFLANRYTHTSISK